MLNWSLLSTTVPDSAMNACSIASSGRLSTE